MIENNLENTVTVFVVYFCVDCENDVLGLISTEVLFRLDAFSWGLASNAIVLRFVVHQADAGTLA